MMKNIFLIISFSLLTIVNLTVSAKVNTSCDDYRYKQVIFSEVEVTSKVKFSEGKTINGADQELFFDVYEPKGDTVSRRAVVVLAFGGSFIEGDRLQLASICTEYAKRGYVAVSIDYRLYDKPLIPLPTTPEMLDVVIKAMIDMDAAVSYLYDDAKGDNTYRIDSELIFVGGVSAGSITATNYAMTDYSDQIGAEVQTALDANNEIDGISNSEDRIKLKGVVNFSGAIRDAAVIDSQDPAVISFHDREDGVVPYGGTEIEIFGQKIIYVEGSYLIDSAAKAVGVKSELNTIEGDGHVSYLSSPSGIVDAMTKSSLFMYDVICNQVSSREELAIGNEVKLYPNPAINEINLGGVKNNSGVLITDISGKTVYQGTAVSDLHRISTRDFSSGVYFIRITSETDSQTIQFQKL